VTFSLWTPPALLKPIEDCDDVERKIAGKCWDLAGVQAALASQALNVTLSASAQATMQVELAWDSSDLVGFFRCLHPARYRDSEWCLPKGHNGKFPALAADTYCMGYSRLKGEENQKTHPWVYMKFTVREKASTVLVYSVHPERTP